MKRIPGILVLGILLSCYLPSHLNHVEVKALAGYPVHNLDTGLNYAIIQEAIDANETLDGHTIFVGEGTYFEHVTIDKSLTLLGEGRETTIIDGNMTGNVVRITHDHVNIRGFTIQRSGRASSNSGISISSTRHCDISANRIVDNERGVYGSPENTSISSNTITNNHIGIAIDPGATYNIISRNRLTANTVSIHVFYANSNNISKNNMTNNWRSITIGYSRDNRLYHNTFFNNTEPILILASGYTNIWDCGYPSGGNYWGNYNGTDSNLDGIGDSWHEIGENNVDHYPLMGMLSSFNTSLGKHVNIISNSTIDDFEYFESNNTIRMGVSGGEGFGFCRVTIPHALMSVSSISVIIDDGLTPVLYHNYTLYDNGTHRWIYFSYPYSTHEIDIIPEFPLFFIIPPFMIATLLLVIVYGKEQRTKLHT